MSILHNVRRIADLSRPRPQLAGVADGFTAYPFIDNLFDFTGIIGSDKTLAAGPIPGASTKRVAIIGAGAAGMCAAYELLKCGVTPVVFEASQRVGGRAWSKHFTESDGSEAAAFAEMGSMRVPPAQLTFWSYAKQFGLHSGGKFPDPGKVETRLYYENATYDWQVDAPAPGPFGKIAQDFGNWITTLEGQLYPQFSAWQQDPSPANEAALTGAWQKFIDSYKGQTFYAAVAATMPGWTSEDMNAFGALGVGSGGFGPLYPINMLEMARILLLQMEDNQQSFPSGMEAMPLAFYTTPVNGNSLQDLGAVRFGTRVQDVSYDTDGGQPTLTTECGTTESYDAVIVATTSRAMSMLGLTMPTKPGQQPVLEQDVEEAIRAIHLTSSSKMFIRTETKFWEQDNQPIPGFPMTIVTDELPRAAYCLDQEGTDNGVVLISYTWEDDSRRIEGLPTAQRFELLRDMLYEIAPEWRGKLVPVNDEILNVDWQQEQDYFGAFKLDYPGQEPDVRAAYFQFLSVLDASTDRGIYIAGDSNSWAGGWTEGALQTGLNAATAVVQRLGGTLPTPNALQQEPHRYDYDL